MVDVRLLLVEDDVALARVVVRGLREEGHAVDHAGTLAEADEMCSFNDYALVVLDVGLPDGDGLDLCRQLRGDGRARVLLLTARDRLPDKVAGFDSGADDYLTKPFDLPELVARVRALLRRPVTVGGQVLEAADLRMDITTHKVWRAGVLCPLTPKEFSLLQLLMHRLGEVVSRADIREQVWDIHYEGDSNVIDVLVAGLRRKLGLTAAEDVRLDTVRGIGFRLHTDPLEES